MYFVSAFIFHLIWFILFKGELQQFHTSKCVYRSLLFYLVVVVYCVIKNHVIPIIPREKSSNSYVVASTMFPQQVELDDMREWSCISSYQPKLQKSLQGRN